MIYRVTHRAARSCSIHGAASGAVDNPKPARIHLSRLKFCPNKRSHFWRVSEIAKLLVDQDILVFVALISPFESDRVLAKNLFNRNCFVEVFLDAPIDVCISRDVKGLYAQQKLGLVENMTGITSVYEPPSNPDIYLRTDRMNEPQCIEVISTYLEKLLLLQFNWE